MQGIAVFPEKAINVGGLISSVIDSLLTNSPVSLIGLQDLPKIKFKSGRGKITVRRLLRRKHDRSL